MMKTIITVIRSSVLRSMPISIWDFSSTRNYPVIATCSSGRILTHYSNGNTHLPNAGLNTIGGRIGLVYTLNPIEESHHEIGTARSLPANQLYLSSFWQRVSYDVILYGATRAKGVMLGDEPIFFQVSSASSDLTSTRCTNSTGS